MGSAFLSVISELVEKFKPKLITWIVEKHISYSQVKDKDFQEFIESYFLGAVSAEALLPSSDNIIRS